MTDTTLRTLVMCGLLSVGCGADGNDAVPARTEPPAQPVAAGGQQAGSTGRFDNPTATLPPYTPGSPPASMQSAPGCEPGVYLGTYDCDVDFGIGPLPLEGDVSFNLEVSAMPAAQGCQEFCVDLAIATASSTLFGVAGAVSFESKLTGGLDCRTGEFRASVDNGIYGFGEQIDPSDPDSLWRVAQPSFGTFVGNLSGSYTPALPQIQGMWNLKDDLTGTTCEGPFKVKRRE